MNHLRGVSISILTAIILFSGVLPAGAQTFPEFLGDACWQYSSPSDGDFGFLRLGITDMSGPSGLHFNMAGVVTSTSALPIVDSTITGNAEVLSDGIHFTLTRSRFSGSGLTQSVMHIVLDANLNGLFREEAIFDDSQQSAVTSFRSGSLFLTSLSSCP